MSEKVEEIRKKYEADADMRGSKPRFGFFSIPPSHTAAKTDYRKTKNRKNNDGRVSVELKNIFAGGTRSGVLRKSYFSVPKSIYLGDPYIKDEKKQAVLTKQKSADQKQVFKPAKLNRTLSTAAYKYVCENPDKKMPKRNRNSDGGVITKQRNIFTNSMSKIAKENNRSFKYTESDYDNAKKLKNEELLRSIAKRRGEGPFRSGSPVRQFFCTNIEAYNDHEMKPKIKKVGKNVKDFVPHEGAFRPSCRPRNTLFSYPKHDSSIIQTLKLKDASKSSEPKNTVPMPNQGGQQNKRQPFRLSSKKQSSKPCPTIAYSKLSIMRKIR